MAGNHRRDAQLAGELERHLVSLRSLPVWLVGQNEILNGITTDAANNVGVDDVLDYLTELSELLSLIIPEVATLKQRAAEVYASLTGG